MLENPPPIADLVRSHADLGLAPDQMRELAEQLAQTRSTFVRLQLYYQCGIEEILTKVNILRQEFEATHAYSPIEHVRSRLKSPESLLDKAVRIGCEFDEASIRERVRDIAGIRITCSFVPDVYWIAQMLSEQPDLTLLFDVSTEVSRARLTRAEANGRELDKFEAERQDFFERVRAAYLARAAGEPRRFRVLDSTRPIADVRAELAAVLASL